MTAPPSPLPPGAGSDARTPSRAPGDPKAGPTALDAQAAVWAARRQDGLTGPEEAELQAWLAGDPARGVRLAQLSSVWPALAQLAPVDVARLRSAALGTASDGASARPVVPPSPGRVRRPPDPHPHRLARPPSRTGLRPRVAAAGLAAVMLVGAGWAGWAHWQRQPTFAQELATARGQQLAVTLPEGTQVRLDTATRMQVTLYRDRREVQLPEGQAMFEVAPDAGRPFHVRAGPMRITVLGTRFSVRHAPDGAAPGQVKVVVEEGHVRVAKALDGAPAGNGTESPPPLAPPEADAVELFAGQAVVADGQGHLAAVTRPPVGDALAWRSGRLVLNDLPLGDAVAEFERYADTGLVIRDPAVAALRLNGSFDLRQVQAFKKALPQALPVRLRAGPGDTTEVVAAD